MTRKECRKVNKNAGFSLLELLIAVIILAIIVIPLLHMFVTSTRINIKSRQTLRATTFAQDIMEGLKAYNIDELKRQFNEPVEGFYVINDKLIKGSVQEDTDREKAANGTDLNGNPNPGLYYFTMSGVTMQGSEYDALIEVDARGYMENAPDSVPDSEKSNYGGHSVTIDGDPNPFYLNNDQFSVISSVDEKRDGVFKEEDRNRERALEDANEYFYHAEGGTDPNWDWETEGFSYGSPEVSVSRIITVNITDAGTDAEGNPLFDADISYKYEWSKNGVMYTPYGVKDDTGARIDGLPCGDGVSSGNFYLFYYPLYQSNDEEIIINNEADVPLRFFIVKQIDTTTDAALTDARLSAAEKVYQAHVDVAAGSRDKIKIRTNLGFNLVNQKFLTGEGVANQVVLGQAVIMYNGVNDTEMDVYDLSGIRNDDLGAAGTNDDITEVIYDVTVSVYEAGAAANGFPDEDRMVVISGSKNN